MPSLPYPKSLVSPTGSIARDRGHNFWGNGSLNRERRPSEDQSARSSSLTSVIEMYYRLPSGSEPILQHTIRQAGSFYYDYTEGFESTCSQVDFLEHRAVSPLAPIPQRALSLAKALILRDEDKTHLDAVMDISVKDSSVSSGDDGQLQESEYVNDIETLPSQRMNCRTAPPKLEPFTFEVDRASGSLSSNLDVAPGLAEALSSRVATEKTQPSLALQEVTTPMGCKPIETGAPVDEEPLNTKTKALETSSDPSSPNRQLDNGCQNKAELLENTTPRHDEATAFPGKLTAKEDASRRAPSRSGLAAVLQSSSRHSVDPGLSDLASLVSSFERIAKPSFIRKDERVSGGSNTADQAGLQSSKRPGVGPVVIDVATDDGAVANAETHAVFRSKKPFYKGHRRNQALVNIRATSLRARRSASVGSIGWPLPASDSPSTTAALRVSTSYPYLMKALPVLPNDALTPAQEVSKASAEDLGFPVRFSPFQLELLATPRSSPRITAQKNVEDHESFRASVELEVGSADSAQPFAECPLTASKTAQVEDMDAVGQPHEKSKNQSQDNDEELSPTKRRLRLRATRSGAKLKTTCFQEIESGTVRRHPRHEQNILTEVPALPTEDLLTPIRRGRGQSSTVHQRRGRQIALGLSGRQCDITHLARHPPTARVLGDIYLHESDIPLAHPVDANILRHSTSTYGFDLSDSRSFGSERTFIRPRNLKKKLSNMKIRLTKSRLNFRDHTDNKVERQPRQNRAIGPSSPDGTILRPTVPPNQSKWMGRKMRRWIRRAVRVCVKGRRGENKPVP
ncbi:hypothetical protein LX36DRAFT_120460 [Colletotrichum falcatum]|nr:hypothetical protein LX36DRAFT_120460 [Colletotrichum falcatum]